MNKRLSARRLPALAFLTLFTSLYALPPMRMEPCPACHGRRSLSLTPPNLGQFDGEIGVPPGQPFKTHRWDVRYDTCPLCNGAGCHERWTMARVPPPEDAHMTPCVACLGTGVQPCQKCGKTGYAPCSRCKGGKKPGWILTEKRTTGRTSRHKRKTVTPCATCGGVGKAACQACDGRGGTICKKCDGAGHVARKERK